MSAGTLVIGGVIAAAVAYKHWPTLNTLKQKQQFAVAVAIIFVVHCLISTGRHASADNRFRDQFQLPASAVIAEMRMPHQGMPSRAVYQIPDAEWDQFLASLNTTPTPFEFRFSGDPLRHAQIAQWKEFPPVMYAADAPKHLLDIPRVYDYYWDYNVKNGKMLCIVYVELSASGARACENATKNDPILAVAVGVIDFDNKLVHMYTRDHSGGLRLF